MEKQNSLAAGVAALTEKHMEMVLALQQANLAEQAARKDLQNYVKSLAGRIYKEWPIAVVEEFVSELVRLCGMRLE